MFKDFFSGILPNFVRVYTLPFLPFHLLAIALTAALVLTDFDWWYFEHTRGPLLLALTLPAAIVGMLFPIIGVVGMYLWAEFRKNARTMLAAAAVGQAGILGLLVTSLYKVFTGRQQPEFYTYTSSVDISKIFHFGILQHGVFYGWPSSHVAVAFAMTSALIIMYSDIKWIRYLATLYALYIGIGVSISIHWFSDALAGAIIGSIAGIVVARSFRALRS